MDSMRKGFTIIELMIVLSVVGIVLAISVPRMRV
ncbi:MAG: prepilin-type N-terminal cleavage/methylation domain-containing protein, partial [Gammaproteobacteria bacterium]|nr:prepilin-type N-terminal cleavage/methylation domain-containing protein [Gemmatimonadota bacterium]NIU80534.1 prepilin-type N-terminal cleavage/methylation domain-containing protein [Gammaproteobacteria bacterium]